MILECLLMALLRRKELGPLQRSRADVRWIAGT